MLWVTEAQKKTKVVELLRGHDKDDRVRRGGRGDRLSLFRGILSLVRGILTVVAVRGITFFFFCVLGVLKRLLRFGKLIRLYVFGASFIGVFQTILFLFVLLCNTVVVRGVSKAVAI